MLCGVKIYQLTLAALIPYYHITGNLVTPDIGDVLEEVEDSEASVMVTVIINNHSDLKMILEEVDIGCGVISNNSALPEVLDPDSSYIVYTEKSSGLTGVCMAASYSVTSDPGLAVVAMWSQPYDLNLYTAYTGAGVTRDRARYSQGLFYAMYYGTGQWSRRGAGTQARYEMEGVEVTTNMTYNTDTYKPVILWDIYEIEHARIMNLTPDLPNENTHFDDVDDKDDYDTANPQTSSLQLQPLCSDVEAECSGGKALDVLQIIFVLNIQFIIRNFY